MDEREQVLTELRGIVETKGKLSPLLRMRVEQLYLQLYGVKFHRTSCSDCYHDAAIRMYLYLKKGGNMTAKTKEYQLRRGMIATVDGKDYTCITLSDENAEKYLKEKPERAKFFEKVPTDWKERIKTVKVETPAVEETPVAEETATTKKTTKKK